MSNLNNNTSQLESLLAKVNALPDAGNTGVELPSLSNEGSPSDLLEGKQLIDDEGKVVTGTFTIDNELTTQDDLITQIQTALENKASASEPKLQDKTITPTKESQSVEADAGYDGLDTVTVNAIPSNYIIPSGTKTITANGTYNVTDNASVVVAIPEKEIVLQNKTIKANGTYSADEGYDGLGQVTIEVAGSANTEAEELGAFLNNSLTILDNSVATSLRSRACQGATKLVTVNLPNVTSLGSYAFYGCSGLETAKIPKLTSVSTQTFYSCTKLKHADCGQLSNLPAQTFNACSALTELILRKTGSICTLSNVNAINNSPIGKGTGYIYVPAALVDTYKTATNWATFANQIRAIEDYPDICGV